MKKIIESLPTKAKEKQAENKKYLTKLKKRTPKKFDHIMQELHDNEFKKTDCLDCANCCKTTGPLFTNTDIDRISKAFKMKRDVFISEYLQIDEENDYILQQVPCTFLNEDNSCYIYDIRPRACREFPHTDRKNFQKINSITLNNLPVCPAVFNIIEKLKTTLPL